MKIPFFSRSIELKVSKAHEVHVMNPGKPVWMSRNYRAFATEGYRQNIVVKQSIEKLANAAASIKWQVKEKGNPDLLDEHPLLELLDRPNPKQSPQSFWRDHISYMLIDGNAYTEMVRNGERVLELWTLRPDRMKIIQGATGLPAAYEYDAGRGARRFPANPITGESDINHTQLFHPLHDWVGQSPIDSAVYAIDIHNEAMRWLKSLLQNSARPSGALVLEKETSLNDEEFKRLKEEIEQNYTGSANAGRPMLLEGGLDWKQMALTPEELSYVEMKDSAARDISLAFGIPPLLLNIPGDNTYSNYREARLGFYEDTVIPLILYVVSDFNRWISPYFNGARLVPDYDSIEAIADKRRATWKMVDSSAELTVNEARELKGFPPLPAPLGDMLLADIRGGSEPEPDQVDVAEDAKQNLRRLAYGRT